MLKSFSITDIGKKRTSNQDLVFTSETPMGNLPNLFLLADGMGGYNGGDIASAYSAEVAKAVVLNCHEDNPRKIFETAIEIANTEIRRKAKETVELDSMGTTMVVATIVDSVLQVANVGDSRLYVISDELRQITNDHSYVEEMIKVGSLDRQSARNHPQKNIITRAIGAEDEIEPDFFTVKLKKGQKVLMCSDGLTNMIEDDDIFKIIKESKSLEEAGLNLVRTANDNGGKDNVSVILIDPFAD